MHIVSWNVNGLRAAAKKGFIDWLHSSNADIIGLQEVRAKPEQLAKDLEHPSGWHTHFVSAKRPGYSGVALYSKWAPDCIRTELKVAKFDEEGRLIMARFGKLLLVNVYFPNGSGKNRDNSRIPFKLSFYRHLFDLLKKLQAEGERILVIGDFNTAHAQIDLARPKQNQTTSGFCPEERQELDRWLNSGWSDTFREYQKDGGHYTWWSNRKGVRERNVGWRIDYVLASEGAKKYLKSAYVCSDVYGSDHCPVGVEVDEKILV